MTNQNKTIASILGGTTAKVSNAVKYAVTEKPIDEYKQSIIKGTFWSVKIASKLFIAAIIIGTIFTGYEAWNQMKKCEDPGYIYKYRCN